MADELKPCPTCNGYGRIDVSDTGAPEVDVCPDCEGTGEARTPTPAPQGAPTPQGMINKDLIRELKHHAQEWSGRIVGDRLSEAADALATSDARIATARNEALEEATDKLENGGFPTAAAIIRALKTPEVDG